VENFEDQILELNPPINAQQVQNLSRQADELTTSIEKELPTGDRCVNELSTRVEELVRRIGTLRPEIRISLPGQEEDPGEAAGQREQFLNELIGRLRERQGVSPGEGRQDLAERLRGQTAGNIEIGQRNNL
jgi:hypothetical protein